MASVAVAATKSLSATVGGRVFTPAVPVVDASFPTAPEEAFGKSLAAYCSQHIPLESENGIRQREKVLLELGAVCHEWIRSTCAKKGVPVASGSKPHLYTSGSYRLGVHEPGADIDCILVAPSTCQRDADFFGILPHSDDEDEASKRQPDSLAERIRRHPDVTNFVPVEGAAVPILTFDWCAINIDLLFARLPTPTIPPDFDIDNDVVLDGADTATEKSINGPRVTNLIAALMRGTPERYQTFLTVVRCVRRWAKRRGLYSNKLGYWGGVNCNLAVALVTQLYPNANAATLLRKFFLVLTHWRWPQPILLTQPHDAGYGLPVWSAAGRFQQVAPMITPAYPAMNSTLAMSRSSLQILQRELQRGHSICSQLWQEQQNGEEMLDWESLFSPADFFIQYPVRWF